MTLHGTDVRLALAQRESVVFVCEEGYGWCLVNALHGAQKELLKPKKSLIILKMKKHKEERIGPNQYIHFLLVMESVCNSSLNRIDLQSSCFFLFSPAISFSPFTSANCFIIYANLYLST